MLGRRCRRPAGTRRRTGRPCITARTSPGSRTSRRRCSGSGRNVWVCTRSAPGDNFFELGGDSLLAIGVAMTATHEGVELTPQDLYDHHSCRPGGHLVARYAEGGLASCRAVTSLSPRPAEHSSLPRQRVGSRAVGGRRWCCVGSKVRVEDVQAVMTAVINHHDALRMRVAERAGHGSSTSAPRGLRRPGSRCLPADGPRKRPGARSGLGRSLDEQSVGGCAWPLTATHHRRAGRPTVPGAHRVRMVDDAASREVLLTDCRPHSGNGWPAGHRADPAATTWRSGRSGARRSPPTRRCSTAETTGSTTPQADGAAGRSRDIQRRDPGPMT